MAQASYGKCLATAPATSSYQYCAIAGNVGWWPKTHGEATQDFVIVDTGAAITVLTKRWVDTRSLTMKKKLVVYILDTSGTVV